ncbi:hypothetical protein [Haloarchaeobius litoreus]|uniref:Uncharacterized protein n=1 Tax=Haloarchaeobius litoreus TaxID=755306 RepID=A0ABD6DHH6_9EURY|nr:hypothetical protein [Haloarchaeobius litoreus]
MTQYPKQTNDGLPTEERILWIAGALGLLVAFLLTAAVVFATVGTGTLTAGYVPVALVFTALLVLVVAAMRHYGTPRPR